MNSSTKISPSGKLFLEEFRRLLAEQTARLDQRFDERNTWLDRRFAAFGSALSGTGCEATSTDPIDTLAPSIATSTVMAAPAPSGTAAVATAPALSWVAPTPSASTSTASPVFASRTPQAISSLELTTPPHPTAGNKRGQAMPQGTDVELDLRDPPTRSPSLRTPALGYSADPLMEKLSGRVAALDLPSASPAERFAAAAKPDPPRTVVVMGGGAVRTDAAVLDAASSVRYVVSTTTGGVATQWYSTPLSIALQAFGASNNCLTGAALAAVASTRLHLCSNDFADKFGHGNTDLDTKLTGPARCCATCDLLVIECNAHLDARLVLDEMRQRYITNLTSASWMGVVLFGPVAVVQEVPEVFEQIAKHISEILWPPPMQFKIQTDGAQLRPLPWPSFRKELLTCILVLSISMAGCALIPGLIQRKCGGKCQCLFLEGNQLRDIGEDFECLVLFQQKLWPPSLLILMLNMRVLILLPWSFCSMVDSDLMIWFFNWLWKPPWFPFTYYQAVQKKHEKAQWPFVTVELLSLLQKQLWPPQAPSASCAYIQVPKCMRVIFFGQRCIIDVDLFATGDGTDSILFCLFVTTMLLWPEFL